MCGIVGYIGSEEATGILLNGLRELEYRGYDSAGVAVAEANGIQCFKAVGKLDNLEQKLNSFQSQGPVTAIGHTRWATHGKPTEQNAHPHGLVHSQVVHNGIIENYMQLRSTVETPFQSQTDTEVIVHIFEQQLGQSENAEKAFRSTLDMLDGAFAILLISEKEPGKIFFARKGSPLQLGFSDRGCFFASSDAALVGCCKKAVYLEDDHWGWATETKPHVFNAEGEQLEPLTNQVPASNLAARKEGYRYFMEKEIYEQGAVLSNILAGRQKNNHIELEELPGEWLLPFNSITLCACGTSYHAAMTGAYLLERLAKVPTNVEIASEYRYREPVMSKDGLFVVISQSGETADTLEVIKMAKAQGVPTLAFCNVDNSSIVRIADKTILLRAGIEKGVASTKAFSAQVMSLWMLAVYWGQVKGCMQAAEVASETAAMRQSHEVIQIQPTVHDRIHRLSKRYLHGHGFFFIGRDIFYPLALEGALKLKEISYLHAEGYPAGEMKHGPIALVDAELFTIALMAKSSLYDKIKSNVEELSARDSTIVAITTEYFELADDIIQIESYDHPMLEFFAMLVVVQLLAMEIAIRLGNDVDMPRNLAKCVTVE